MGACSLAPVDSMSWHILASAFRLSLTLATRGISARSARRWPSLASRLRFRDGQGDGCCCNSNSSGDAGAFNPFISLLLRLGIPMGTIYLLTTTGRRSGRPRTTPVSLVVDDGRRWLVSPYGAVGWARNVRASGRARLTRGRKSEEIRLTETPPTDAV